MLLLITGLPGSGKTTLARSYASKFGGVHLNSDLIRAELGLRGHYTPADKQRVYETLFQRADNALQNDQDVVIDSTLFRKSLRQPYYDLAQKWHTPLFVVVTQAAEKTLQERVSQPRPDSEADQQVLERIQAQYEPVTEEHLELHTDQMKLEELSDAVRAYTLQHGN
ncbi:MAG: ATP-binding protein [Lewinellaceae bacterium]|nr:ATP-binding protein [Lewinellaceae bacterium]